MTIPSILSAIAALGGVLLVVLLAGRGARMIRLARHGGGCIWSPATAARSCF
jgi:hypothetical protein